MSSGEADAEDAGAFGPISEVEAVAAFEMLRDDRRFVLAVSGGPDSMALMGLIARWRKGLQHPPEVKVICVDHGLREEAAEECIMVCDEAEKLGLPAAVHALPDKLPKTGVQEAAREARYEVLKEAASAFGAQTIVTAHHADDQAETVLARLLHGSGPAGLAGMRPVLKLPEGFRIARPCLGWSKGRLVATVRALGLPFSTDPTNLSPKYERGRLRAAMPQFAALGLTPDRLLLLASRAVRADDALAAVARDAEADHKVGSHWAFDRFFLDRPDEIVIRVLQMQLGGPAATKLERLERLLGELRAARDAREPLRRTAAGHIVELGTDGVLRFRLEGQRRRGHRW